MKKPSSVATAKAGKDIYCEESISNTITEERVVREDS